PDGVVIVDHTGRITYANEQLARLLAAPDAAALEGAVYSEFVGPEDQERAAAELATLVSGAAAATELELTLLRRSGSPFPAEIRGSALAGEDGSPPAVLAVIRDITERRRYEDELR